MDQARKEQERSQQRSKVTHVMNLQQLPRRNAIKLWGGRGDGLPCSCCGKPIGNSQAQFDLEFDADWPMMRVHVACYLKWRADVHRS